MTDVSEKRTEKDTARRMWRFFEPVHAVTYFTHEARSAADGLGLQGFWAGYVAQRAAPLGAVGPAAATAAFFGFHHDRIDGALPDAWRVTTPAAALEARLDGVDGALGRLWGDLLTSSDVREAADLAWQAATTVDCAGRVLAAANQTLPRPATAHLALWQATTTLREHRGDGHVAVLVTRGITPVQAHLLKAATGEADSEALRKGRRFSVPEWQEGVEDMRAAGLLDADAQATPAGRSLHEQIEEATDGAAVQPWQALGETATSRLASLLAPLADAVLDSGTLPMPNPVGLTLGPSADAAGGADQRGRRPV